MTKRSPESRVGVAAPALDGDAAGRATRVLWAALAILAAARLAFSFVPSMAAWSLNLARFLPPAAAWVPWALAAAALVPILARPVTPWLARAGDAIADAPWRSGAVGALVAGAIAAAFPDRTFFVGDFVLRMGSAVGHVSTALLFPQALPLDLFVHHTLPLVVGSVTGDIQGVERALGVVEAAVFGALAPAFVRTLGLRGAAAFAACAIVLAGGYAALFTGFGKAFRELCVLALALGLCGVRVARTGRGYGALAVAGAVAMAFHRSAVAFLPAIAVAAFAGYARGGRAGDRPGWTPGVRLAAAAGTVALPVVVLAASIPRILGAMRTIDRAHLAPGGAGATLAGAVAPLHLIDMANTIVVLSPLALPAALAAIVARPDVRVHRQAWVLAALAVPALAILALVHPRQGMFRDQDVFAASGVTLSLAAAWLVGHALRDARHAWLAPAVVLAAAAPTVQWLAIHRAPTRGLARVEAFLAEPPAREEGERAFATSYLATRYAMLGRLDDAAVAAARTAELAPSPRFLLEWGDAERARGDLVRARAVYTRLVVKASPFALGWQRLGETALALGDLDGARAAAAEAQALEPDSPATRALLGDIARATAERDAAVPKGTR